MIQMQFMIDLENVFSRGLRGTEYLEPEDCVDIFYSNSCRKIEQEPFRNIMKSNARLKIYKLKNASKNALDFYIACHIGEVFGAGYQGTIAIVSNDKGYKAVRDYWSTYADSERRIVLGESIQQCIISANENSERHRIIKQKLGSVDLETEYARYEERHRLQMRLAEVLADTEYEKLVGKIFDTVGEETSKKVIYLDMLKKFGKKSGLEIYNRIKHMC